ncbi:hypothetical protein ES703_114493 [subsurface metagenome]
MFLRSVMSRHVLRMKFFPPMETALLLTRMSRISPLFVLCFVSKVSASSPTILSMCFLTCLVDSIISKSVIFSFRNSSQVYPRISCALALNSVSAPVSVSISTTESAACSKIARYFFSLSRSASVVFLCSALSIISHLPSRLIRAN